MLGFEPRIDAEMWPGARWVTVGHPDHPELEITLMLPGPPLSDEAAAFVRDQLGKGAMGGLGLQVDDCRATYAELSAKGVEFLQEPAERPYGVEAVIRDNSGQLARPRREADGLTDSPVCVGPAASSRSGTGSSSPGTRSGTCASAWSWAASGRWSSTLAAPRSRAARSSTTSPGWRFRSR